MCANYIVTHAFLMTTLFSIYFGKKMNLPQYRTKNNHDIIVTVIKWLNALAINCAIQKTPIYFHVFNEKRSQT